jgi:putative transposase
VYRSFVFKLKPTAAQRLAPVRYLTVTGMVYNAALEQRQTAFRLTGRAPSWIVQKREIKQLRAAGLLEGCHVHTVQAALRWLDRAFARFFAGQAGYPRFKAGRHWRSFEFFEHGNGWRLDTDRQLLRIAAVGQVRVRLHRQPAGTVKTLTVVRKADGWYAHVVCEVAAASAHSEPCYGALDLGVQALATLHTGEAILNPRNLDRAARKLRAEQRALHRKRRGSNRRRKQADRIARAYLHLARARRDHLHKVSRMLANRYTHIAVEDFKVTAMTRSAKGTMEQPGRNVRQKAGLNRAILDAGWAELLSLLEYKLDGGHRKVPAAGTSQDCSGCGQRVPKALAVRWHGCPHCGTSLNRDHNAALNIYQRAWAGSVVEAA